MEAGLTVNQPLLGAKGVRFPHRALAGSLKVARHSKTLGRYPRENGANPFRPTKERKNDHGMAIGGRLQGLIASDTGSIPVLITNTEV